MSREVLVALADRRLLRVRMEGEELVLEVDGAAVLRLAREDGWQLAEAVERVATRC